MFSAAAQVSAHFTSRHQKAPELAPTKRSVGKRLIERAELCG